MGGEGSEGLLGQLFELYCDLLPGGGDALARLGQPFVPHVEGECRLPAQMAAELPEKCVPLPENALQVGPLPGQPGAGCPR